LTNAAGMPLTKQSVKLDRPAGPLAELCWPAEWHSDGAGRIYIPALEVGHHRFHVMADNSTHDFEVPASQAGAVRAVKVIVDTKAGKRL
jgi:hypothetical protein